MLFLGCFVLANTNCLEKKILLKKEIEHFSIPTVAAITGSKIHIYRAWQIRAEWQFVFYSLVARDPKENQVSCPSNSQ